jgi:fatty acid synthase
MCLKNCDVVYVFVISGVSGKLEWQGNWISFMDTMLQFSILGQNTRELYLPTRLQRAIINTRKHKEIVEALSWGEGELHLCYLF